PTTGVAGAGGGAGRPRAADAGGPAGGETAPAGDPPVPEPVHGAPPPAGRGRGAGPRHPPGGRTADRRGARGPLGTDHSPPFLQHGQDVVARQPDPPVSPRLRPRDCPGGGVPRRRGPATPVWRVALLPEPGNARRGVCRGGVRCVAGPRPGQPSDVAV